MATFSSYVELPEGNGFNGDTIWYIMIWNAGGAGYDWLWQIWDSQKAYDLKMTCRSDYGVEYGRLIIFSYFFNPNRRFDLNLGYFSDFEYVKYSLKVSQRFL